MSSMIVTSTAKGGAIEADHRITTTIGYPTSPPESAVQAYLLKPSPAPTYITGSQLCAGVYSAKPGCNKLHTVAPWLLATDGSCRTAQPQR